MNKQKIFLLFIFFILLLSVVPIIKSDRQTWENEYGKLVVYPMVSRNLIRQKQYYEISWYKPSNNLDIAFSFDKPLSKGQIFYWNGSAYNKLNVNHVEYNGKHYYVVEDIFFNQDETKKGYWEYNTPVNSKGKWDMYIKLHGDSWTYAFNNDRFVHLDPWWNSNWVYKKKITIDHDQVPKNLKNFPVFINLSSDPNLVDNIGYSNGSDIAFVDSTETSKYNHELVYFDDSTGKLCAWVNITTLSSTGDTVLYIYYGNSNCANQSNPGGTWDSNYKGVYHMTGSSYSGIVDSTSNGYDAENEGDSPTYNQDAICGRGVSFDGDDDYIVLTDCDDYSFSQGSGSDVYFTIEALYKKSDSNKNPIISKYPEGTGAINYREWYMWIHDTDLAKLAVYDDAHNAQVSRNGLYELLNDKYYYTAFVYNNTGGTTSYLDMILYNNSFNHSGSGANGANYDYMLRGSVKVTIGFRGSNPGGEYFNGVIDEIRISKNIARNSSWITATYNTMFNGTDGGFFTFGNEESTSNIESPTGFQAATLSNGNIFVNWTMGVNTTDTRVEYNTVSSWSRGNGNLLYNGSDLDETLTGTSCNIRYYFLAWGYNSSQNNWSTSANCSNISCPGNPSSVDIIIYPTILNITWVSNSYATSTVVIRKSNSYPSSPSDGTILQNDSKQYYDDNTVDYSTHYYKLYSWNDTVKRYSNGYEIPLTSLSINVYNESDGSAVENWNVFISNEDGTEVYESLGNDNTLNIDLNDVPTGDITIVINHTGYTDKVFVMTIVENTAYSQDVYLAFEDETESYIIYVVGPENEYGYEPPIEDATITIKRYINDTTGWGDVTIRKTSASGMVTVGLIPGMQYHITITKTNYNTFYDIFIPPPIEYAEDRYHTFRLVSSSPEYPSYDDFWEDITFTGVMVDAGYLQLGNITISYSDSNISTVNTRVYLYEVYNNTITLKDNYYQTDDSYSRTISGINTSRYHYAKLYFNTTASYVVSSPVVLPIYSIHTYIRTGSLDLDQRIRNLFGPPPIGSEYTELIALVVPMMILCLLGVFNTGIGIIGCGLSIGLVQGLYSGYGISINLGLFALAPFIIFIGIIYMWTKRQGVDHL